MSTGSPARRRPFPVVPGLLVAVAVLTAVSAGCGIRPTEVPVDAGPAPTQATCDPPTRQEGTNVYLVCGTQVQAVRRTVDLSRQRDSLDLARALLTELQSEPGHAERAAGFSSDVPPSLSVAGIVDGGAHGPGLRLSQSPAELSAFALVQIVCTFAHSEEFGSDDSVVISGPSGASNEKAMPYSCTAAMRITPLPS